MFDLNCWPSDSEFYLQYGRPRPSCTGWGSYRWLKTTVAHIFKNTDSYCYKKKTWTTFGVSLFLSETELFSGVTGVVTPQIQLLIEAVSL